MGKRARKTRWRTLDIADEHSDSEESNTNSSAVSSRYSRSNSNGYYSYSSNNYSYSSQSTPARRKFSHYESSTKSTRSSSTTSENKITFNEDEYTRITTPRQDVLFKKGYLNKPKSYLTQTSTGTSTISTGNSTENGTPDHQSADLDYESQFVFPNGFMDQNGIYYVNSYEPYPLMLFNPPPYYQDYSNHKSKRYSTGSLSESVSPNNEETTSQDYSQSGGEASNGAVSDYSGGPPGVISMVYSNYYVNNTCTPPDLINGQNLGSEPVKKLKKRRERKSSKTIPGDSSECSDENSNHDAKQHYRPQQQQQQQSTPQETPNTTPEKSNETLHQHNNDDDSTKKTEETNHQETTIVTKSSTLKADAEEFVPRNYQQLQIKMIPPNFVPIPLVPIGDYASHPAAFIPPPQTSAGFPINFIPQPLPGQKIFPPGFVNYATPVTIVNEPKIEEESEEKGNDQQTAATPFHTPSRVDSAQLHSKTIDIATVVSKLEAVKKQEIMYPAGENNATVTVAVNETQPFRNTPRFNKTHKKNYYNKYMRNPAPSESPKHFVELKPKTEQSPMRYPAEKSACENRKGIRSNKYHLESSPRKTLNQKSVTTESKEHTQVELKTCSSSTNQWISVSSRKKKYKCKNVEEINDKEEAIVKEDDCFESYDVNQLVDVVPPTRQEEDKVKFEEILTSIPQSEITKAHQSAEIVIADIPEVRDIEKEMFSAKPEEEVVVLELPVTEVEVPLKKKSKKGVHKSSVKKVIITDVFEDSNVVEVEEVKVPSNIRSITKNLDETKNTVKEFPEKEQQKKSKKKKKNKIVEKEAVDVNVNNNIPDESSKETISNIPITLKSDKTTDEISLELDKLIQKGMYSSLQEKIKSINVDEPDQDEFFKIIKTPLLTNHQNHHNHHEAVMKTPDFNRIFQSTRQFLKPNMVSVEHDHRDINKVDDTNFKLLNSSTADAAYSGPGHVLNAMIEIPIPETPTNEDREKENVEKNYSIIKAVTEWMDKTRQSKPEVELLKCPSVIKEEFIYAYEDINEQLDDNDDDDDENDDLLENQECDLMSVVSENSCDLTMKDNVVVSCVECCDKSAANNESNKMKKVTAINSGSRNRVPATSCCLQ
ncbi:hypothetical protein ABEB36_007325 [Hypothenemus hampei]|uniref:Uncharacterized protein n=1 Tax=Hypothenemus hampei TaxID=57062 RepID=A0ABD1ETP0_HYPHA